MRKVKMLGYLITLLIGVAIPLIIFWLQDRQKRKYFELERKEKFKIVAIEKRLEAHQQALKLWDELRTVIHKSDNDPQKMEIINTTRDFWYSNSLYLERETRESLQKAFWKLWLDNWKALEPGEEKNKEYKFFNEQWEYFHSIPEIIQQEVELEPIKPTEDKTPEGEEIKKVNK